MNPSSSTPESFVLLGSRGFVKAPYEAANKEFRCSQKMVEREVAEVAQQISLQPNAERLDAVIGQLHGIKRKLVESELEQHKHITSVRRRLERMQTFGRCVF